MKKVIPFIVLVFFAIFILGGDATEYNNTTDVVETTNAPRKLKAGEVFEENSYIVFDNVKITYKGKEFEIENNSESIMMISCSFFGKKSDGTYDFIGMPAFYGIDKTQYEKDLKENGWAIEKTTNRVRPGETLTAKLTVIDFGEDYPEWDIDGDGYYDIRFSFAKQKSEDTITTSTKDTESYYYKLRVDN